jgi:hypothetical protein
VQAADELVQMVGAVHQQLAVPARATVTVSYSGGMFEQPELLLTRVQSLLAKHGTRYRVMSPRLPPVAGAALYAAKLSGAPLSAQAVGVLESQLLRRPLSSTQT